MVGKWEARQDSERPSVPNSRLGAKRGPLSDFSGASFRNATVINVKFYDADLTDTDFLGAILTETDLSDARFSNTTMPDGSIRSS